MRILAVPLIAIVGTASVFAQTPGADVYESNCAVCHSASADVAAGEVRAPALESLRGLSPNAVLNSLTNGKMLVQGEQLSQVERLSVAEFMTGLSISAVSSNNLNSSMCTTITPMADSFARPAWNGWGAGLSNERFQAAEFARLDSQDIPKLQLAWAFGFADALAARTQPTVIGDWLFTAGENAEVYALDARTGCTHWIFQARAAVRTAITVTAYQDVDGAPQHRLHFGDGLAHAYALDAQTGELLWTRKVDDHPNAVITGAPAVYDGQVYVPTSAAGEEVRGPNSDYACCTFRGSVSALNAETGEVIWKTYSIDEEPQPRGQSTNGVQLFGPAGAGIWGSPTIDPDRGTLYVGTGNGFADPVQASTDAIIAMDLQTGAIKWIRQTVPDDNWLWQCESDVNRGNPNCPAVQGPDFDFATSPLLTETDSGRALLVVPQKSGMLFALDPDLGTIVWEYRIGEGSSLGGQWGAAADGRNVYVGVADNLASQPGGMHAVDLESGQRTWYTPPQPTLCEGGAEQLCFAAQGGAVTVIPGVVFSGGTDGGLRAYSSEDGTLLWQYDTNRSFETVNGVIAAGAAIDAAGPVIVDGMLYVNSGYNGIVGRAGNVLLAFRVGEQ